MAHGLMDYGILGNGIVAGVEHLESNESVFTVKERVVGGATRVVGSIKFNEAYFSSTLESQRIAEAFGEVMSVGDIAFEDSTKAKLRAHHNWKSVCDLVNPYLAEDLKVT